MKTWIRIFIIVGLAGRLRAATDPTAPPGKIDQARILAWGQVPVPVYVQKHIEEMEKVPVDGIVMGLFANGHHDQTLKADRRVQFSSACWTPRVWTQADYSESIEALKATKFNRFTDNFLRFNVVPGEVDWFDDGFAGVVANFKLLAEVAKETGMKGIMFDTEAYPPGKVFWYAHQNQAKEHSLEEYKKKVRERGREMMAVASEVFPEIRVIFTLDYENGQSEPEKYGLLPVFLDGMLQGEGPKSVLYDGFEFSYHFKSPEQFAAKRRMMRQEAMKWSTVPELMKEKWRAGFGIWLDYSQKWDPTDFTKNWFTPAEFAYSLHEAMRYTDKYVWIWSEKTGFWTGNLPRPYIDALTDARRENLAQPAARPGFK